MSEYQPKSIKHSFVLYYNNIITAFQMLETFEERGELFTDICNYEMYGEEPLSFSSPSIQAVYCLIAGGLRDNKEKWLLRCEQNSINRTNGTSRTNGTYKDKDIDNDNVNDERE